MRADVDYYNVLGVDKNADKKAIKQAYRYAPMDCLTALMLLACRVPRRSF